MHCHFELWSIGFTFLLFVVVGMLHNKRRRVELGAHAHGAAWPGDDPRNGPQKQRSIPIDHSMLDVYGFHPIHYAVVKGDMLGLTTLIQQAVSTVAGRQFLTDSMKGGEWAGTDSAVLEVLTNHGNAPVYDSGNVSAGSTPVYNTAGSGSSS